MSLSRTCALLEEHIQQDACTIILDYVRSIGRDWKSISFTGEYETCMSCPEEFLDDALYGACEGGHFELAELMIIKGANNFDQGLYCACKSGHSELAELMISKGTNDFDYGLYGAYKGGHSELVELMISYSTTSYVIFD